MSFFWVYSEVTSDSRDSDKANLFYARIQALNKKGAPGWPVGAQKTTKNS